MDLSKLSCVTLLTVVLTCAIAYAASAQTANPQPTPTVQPKVTAIVDGHLEADDLFKVEVDRLAEWASNPANNPAKLVPYLNGLAITGNYPEEIHVSKNHLHFHLRITPENKKVWVDLLG